VNVLGRDELRSLMERHETPCVSIYMPTARAGDQILQNRIRLKNQLEEAERRLVGRGLRAPRAKELLRPSQELVDDELFWQRQSDGLALFLSTDVFYTYRLPLGFDNLVVATDRFHLKPLLSLLSGDGRFYLLALSQDEIRLFQGTRYSVGEVDLEDVPRSLAEALMWEDPERHLQFHTSTRTPGGIGDRPAAFHGQGVGAGDDRKDRVLRYFQQIDEGIGDLLAGTHVPLVLAGVDYLLPIYQEANSYPYLVERAIEGNPEQRSAEKLHREAWGLVQPAFAEARGRAAAQYRQLAGAGSELASCEIEQVVPAAYYERVATLFVALGTQKWGTFNPDTNAVELHETEEPGDQDLLDLAAVHTFLNDGRVYAVEPDEVPDDPSLAAMFRYPL
jgi:hypothetical protein